MGTGESLQGMTELRVGRPVEVRVALDPYTSVLALSTDAVGRHRGAPAEWRRRILSSLQPRSFETMRPLTIAGRSVVPDCVTPLNPVAEVPIEDQIQRVHDLSADVLLRDLGTVFTNGILPSHWRNVADSPRKWLHGYAQTMSKAWGSVAELWTRARPLLDREIERIGIAIVRGNLDVVLDTIHPASSYDTGVLKIRDPEPARFDLDRRSLVLVPMLSGGEALICNFDDPEAVWIAYPLPQIGRLITGREDITDAAAGSLDAMLGPVRATVLRAASRPTTMSELAKLTQLVPSVMTYHCERLASSGLIRRERRGREIHVVLTERGQELIEIFPPSGAA